MKILLTTMALMIGMNAFAQDPRERRRPRHRGLTAICVTVNGGGYQPQVIETGSLIGGGSYSNLDSCNKAVSDQASGLVCGVTRNGGVIIPYKLSEPGVTFPKYGVHRVDQCVRQLKGIKNDLICLYGSSAEYAAIYNFELHKFLDQNYESAASCFGRLEQIPQRRPGRPGRPGGHGHYDEYEDHSHGGPDREEPVPRLPPKQCLSNFGTSACGYNCIANFGQVRCSERPNGACHANFGQVVCWDPPSLRDPKAQCIANYGQVACGYNCRQYPGGVTCDSRP